MSAGGPPGPADPLLEEAGSRRSRILGGVSGGAAEGRRAVLIAVASTVVFFTVVIVAIVNSAGWTVVRQAFFSGHQFAESFPDIARRFLVNVRLFLIAEVFILAFALLLAVMRSLPGPVFFPIRALAIGYVDLFRGIPTILVIYTLGFGAPALQLHGVPRSPFFWAAVALILVYSAYVAEVYRAGIESVHESQSGAARSLGLSQWQSMRYVILPQAIRRVIPPLLNDFIGLQKDTALVSVLGIVEATRQAGIDNAATFNYTPFLATAMLFVLVTIPMTRFTDWLVARDRRRRQVGGGR